MVNPWNCCHDIIAICAVESNSLSTMLGYAMLWLGYAMPPIECNSPCLGIWSRIRCHCLWVLVAMSSLSCSGSIWFGMPCKQCSISAYLSFSSTWLMRIHICIQNINPDSTIKILFCNDKKSWLVEYLEHCYVVCVRAVGFHLLAYVFSAFFRIS